MPCHLLGLRAFHQAAQAPCKKRQTGQAAYLCKLRQQAARLLALTSVVRRWERAEEVRERAEEKARLVPAAAGGRAGAPAHAVPAGAALSIEEKLASKRQIFAPREAFKCAAAARCKHAAVPCTSGPAPARRTASVDPHSWLLSVPACELLPKTGCASAAGGTRRRESV